VITVFWLIVVVGLLALLQGRFFSSVAFKKLTYRRTISRHAVSEGGKIELVEELANNKLTPLPWLRVESKLSPWLRFKSQENLEILDDRYHKSVFFLRSYQKITRRYEITCIHRGYYDLSITSLTAGDLFGAGTASREFHGDARLFVYPALLGDGELPEDALQWQGDVSVKRWIFPDPILINGIREYRSGDTRKDIHWKASARTGILQVKTHDYTVCPRVLLVLNVDPQDQFWGLLSESQQMSMEYGIRSVATLLSWAIENGMDAGFYSNAQLAQDPNAEIAVLPACSDSQLELLMTTLAGIQLQEHESVYRTLERIVEDQICDADILIFSAFWNEALERRADAVRALGNTVAQVVLRKEVVDFEANAAAAV
jgi:uncharacterized protein (DUF58 family)